MTRNLVFRGLWLVGTVALLLALLWLDQHRGGPATMLSRCNLLLSRDASPAADILIVGSSRSGTAFDPVAMQDMLAHEFAGASPTVERITLGQNPLRASAALLENYIEARGAPQVIALEIMFMTNRSVDRLAQRGLAVSPEQYLYRRDLNLMTFKQILRQPAVAMPYSEGEDLLNRWRFRLRGVVLRAGALAYQFFRRPRDAWELSACDRDSWVREPTWPVDFAFTFGDFKPDAPPGEIIERLETEMVEAATDRTLKEWQADASTGQRYPYDFAAQYRQGEVRLLLSMLRLATERGVPVVLLPLPLYGYTPGVDDLRELTSSLPEQVRVFDIYGQVQADLDKFWYDDAHLEAYPAGALTTAILAKHLLDSGVLND